MNRRQLILIIASIATVVVASTISVVLYQSQTREKTNEILSTDESGFAIEDVPSADPLIVGKWSNTENPKWYKVYYDDYDEDGFFWGKEWDESEDVQEEDLNYHGNGWYRWKKDGKQLLELHTMDVRDVPISKVWLYQTECRDKQHSETLVLADPDRRSRIYKFSRVEE